MQYTSRVQGLALATILFLAFAAFALMPRSVSAAAVTLSNATTSSSNASTTLMKVGQTLSFQLNLSSGGLAFATSTPVINIFGMGSSTMNAGVVATTSATSWYYSTTSVSAWAPEGAIPFSIGYPNDDVYGISTTTFSSAASTTLSNVVLDKTAPTLSTIAVASNNSPTTLAKIGSVVTLSFLSDSFIQTPSVTIAGHAATVLSTTTLAKFWTASTTIANLDTSGALAFTITLPKDYANNATTSATWLTAGTNVTVYGSIPVITVSGTNPDTQWASNSTTYSDAGATATDANSGSPSVTSSGSVNLLVSGTYTITYNATDAAGNAAVQKSRSVTVNTPGSGGIVSGGGGGGGGGPVVALPNNGGNAGPASAPSTSGNNSTILALQAQLAALLSQLQALKGVANPSQNAYANANANANASFKRNLTVGSTGDDVRALQAWLNAHGFAVASSGAGSTGNETTRFGGLTRVALAKWQKSVGISPAFGYFGAKTRAYLASH